MSVSIQQVKSRHTTRLMTLPGVVSVGIGKDANGELAIMVGIDKESDAIVSSIPKELEGYPVVIRVMGPIRAQ